MLSFIAEGRYSHNDHNNSVREATSSAWTCIHSPRSYSLATLLLARLLLNLRKAVDRPGSTAGSSGFLDTIQPAHAAGKRLAFVHEAVSDSEDIEMTDVSWSTRRESADVDGPMGSFQLFVGREDSIDHDDV